MPIDGLLHEALQAHGAQQLEKAKELYVNVLRREPSHPVANHNLGLILVQSQSLAGAVVCFKQALQAQPSEPRFWLSCIQATILSGASEVARALIENAVKHGVSPHALHALRLQAIKPAFQGISHQFSEKHQADQLLAAGLQHMALGQHAEAVDAYRQAAELFPTHTEALERLGDTLVALFRHEEAIEVFNQLLMLKPESGWAHLGLGMSLGGVGLISQASECYRLAISLEPSLAVAHTLYAKSLQDLGETGPSIQAYRHALTLSPSEPIANSNLLFLLSYTGRVTPVEYLQEARQWEQRSQTEIERSLARSKTFSHAPLGARRLKVAYMSGDFRQHAVAYFLEQIYQFHDREKIEVYSYMTNPYEDDVSARFKVLSNHWTNIAEIADANVCQLIEAQQIDVLIDLSGHSAHNRLGVIARRAAPVQAHYLGYCASTGLTQMDYWIGDTIVTPSEISSHFSERVWRLPRVWTSYHGREDAPQPRVVDRVDGEIVLGSFNQLGKITEQTYAIWSEILKRLPQAKLLLKTQALSDPQTRNKLLVSFQRFGISANRIDLIGHTNSWADHMRTYDRLDIALDPVGGMGGGTTTCDAMWMGVPVVALTGVAVSQRMTPSILQAVGHAEWVAATKEEYISKVISLAQAKHLLKQHRLDLRDEMRTSPLCDAKGLTQALEAAYQAMFEKFASKLH